MIDNIEKKLENLCLQECSIKNRSLKKLVISLEASFFKQLFLYTVSWRYRRDYLHSSIDTWFYMFCIINTMKKQSLLYHVCNCDTKKIPL